MIYSESPSLADDEVAQENSPRGFARDQDARSESRFGRRAASAPMQSFPAPYARPSIVRRMFRAVTRFLIVVAIGVGATLGWQVYGDMAKAMLAVRAPELAPLLAYLPTKAPPAAATSASPALQLEPLASNLEVVRRSVEQLALRQEQMARNIAALQATDEDIKQKVSSPQPATAQPVAAIPQPKPAPAKPQAAPGAPSSSAPRPAASAAPVSILPR